MKLSLMQICLTESSGTTLDTAFMTVVSEFDPNDQSADLVKRRGGLSSSPDA